MHKTVLNPETGRHVSIKGKTGQSILKKYYNQSGGNPIFIRFPLPHQRHNIDTPDKLLEKQIVYSCDRCNKLIALRQQIDKQLQHSCKRCKGLYQVKQDRERIKQLARPMIQHQQAQQLRDMLKPMLMVPKLTRSKSPSTKLLSEKEVKSAVKPTPKKSPKSTVKPSSKKVKVSVSSPKSTVKPSSKKSPGKVKVKVSPAKKSPKSSRKQTRKK